MFLPARRSSSLYVDPLPEHVRQHRRVDADRRQNCAAGDPLSGQLGSRLNSQLKTLTVPSGESARTRTGPARAPRATTAVTDPSIADGVPDHRAARI